jgi:hypothetical protein
MSAKQKIKNKDFSKVKRYNLGTKTWYEDTYHAMVEADGYGQYVLYEDYKALLDEKAPPRLPADFTDLKEIIDHKISSLEKSAFDIFKRKDTINYGWAVHTYNTAQKYTQVLHDIEHLMHTKNSEE